MPYFVKLVTERNVCCCMYHVEVMLIVATLDRMRDCRLGIYKHDTCDAGYCFCDTCCPPSSYGANGCRAHLMYFIDSTHLWQSYVCVKGEMDLWHKRQCLLGECVDCSVQKKLLFYLSEVDEANIKVVSWRRLNACKWEETMKANPRYECRRFKIHCPI